MGEVEKICFTCRINAFPQFIYSKGSGIELEDCEFHKKQKELVRIELTKEEVLNLTILLNVNLKRPASSEYVETMNSILKKITGSDHKSYQNCTSQK